MWLWESACGLLSLDALELVFFHRLSTVFLLQGIAVVFAFAFAVFVSARKRAFVLRDFAARGGDPRRYVSYNFPNAKPEDPMPSVSIIMPCKGIHENSVGNWRSILAMKYNGHLEFVFVTESEKDEAYIAATKFKKEVIGVPQRSVTVHNAGLSFHNSQKIHNWLGGLAVCAKSSKYVCCFDDDIRMFPASLQSMVLELENDAQVFASTGYSYEIAPPGSSLANFMIVGYRLVLLAAFGTDRPYFLWGGCMLLRHDDIKNNMYGLVDSWRDGGHSEDFLAVSIIKQVKRPISCAYHALFPNVLQSSRTFDNYWNFILRQFFVLGTYCSQFNLVHNLCLAVCQFVLAWFIIAPSWLLLPQAAVFFGKYNGLAGWDTMPANITTHACLFVAYFVALALMFLSLRYKIETFKRMCEVLSEKQEKLPTQQHWKHVIAFWLHVHLLPLATIWALAMRSIVWARVRYHRAAGRIWKMTRPDDNGHLYTVPAAETLDRNVADHIAAGLLTRDNVKVSL